MTEKRRTKTSVPGKGNKVTPIAPKHTRHDSTPIAMQDLLGDKLRAYYKEVASEPVPERFGHLLKELEARSNQKKPN
jgi:hypothetical protein